MSLKPIVKIFKAGEKLYSYHVASLSSDDELAVYSETGNMSPLGVILPNTESKQSYEIGDDVPIQMSGISHVKCHAAVTANKFLAASSTGAVKPTGTEVGQVYGQALENGVAGDIIKINILPRAYETI